MSYQLFLCHWYPNSWFSDSMYLYSICSDTGVYISTLFRNFGYGIVLEFCPFSEKFYVFSKIISEIQQLKKFSRSVLLDKLKKTRKRNQDFLILFGYLNNYPTQLYIVGVNTPWKPVKPFFLIDTAKYEKNGLWKSFRFFELVTE